ncbi:MAG: polyhydroxyalkanoate synthesis regulator DNA-binding domain-containing protein [Candidatus Promineifilaceae bacterium]|nr:polyhydroxyalkanoate synthesis regulator DNA-binding domain-containing protein [Candidatus Promineifilaceae bacterium]
MIVIKRYPNRKLYDTEAKQYITLDGIADLIRSGHEVQIVDHATGDDMTAVTLTQIIFEQEKKQAGFLPRAVLTGLVQSGGQTLANMRRTLASPLDLFHHVDQEIQRRLQKLVELGEMSREEAGQMGERLIAVGRSAADRNEPTEAQLEQALERHGIPSHREVEELSLRLDELVAKLEALEVDTDA